MLNPFQHPHDRPARVLAGWVRGMTLSYSRAPVPVSSHATQRTLTPDPF